MTAFPARRDPASGFVAQRILIHPGHEPGPIGPWLLTTFDPATGVGMQILTDADLADWPPLYDELADEAGAGVLASLPLGPGEDDAEVWIPPHSDGMHHRPKQPCPHCGGPLLHQRTGRCGDCGRRP